MILLNTHARINARTPELHTNTHARSDPRFTCIHTRTHTPTLGSTHTRPHAVHTYTPARSDPRTHARIDRVIMNSCTHKFIMTLLSHYLIHAHTHTHTPLIQRTHIVDFYVFLNLVVLIVQQMYNNCTVNAL